MAARERLTVSDSAESLTPASYGSHQRALITVEGAAIRFTLDGTAPVKDAVGHKRAAEGEIWLDNPGQISKFQAIRDTDDDATLEISYLDPLE